MRRPTHLRSKSKGRSTSRCRGCRGAPGGSWGRPQWRGRLGPSRAGGRGRMHLGMGLGGWARQGGGVAPGAGGGRRAFEEAAGWGGGAAGRLVGGGVVGSGGC